MLWLIPTALVLLILIQIDIAKVRGEGVRHRSKAKRWFFFSRLLIFSLLFIALASPYVIDSNLAVGEQKITLLIDESTSLEVLDRAFVAALPEELEQHTQVDTVFFGDTTKTPLSDTLLDHLEKGRKIVLVTDGHNNYGPALREVLLQAKTVNSSINAILLHHLERDSAIIVTGPDKVSPGVETLFTVHIRGTDVGREKQVVVTVDGVPVIDETTAEESISFVQMFSEGNHRITATLQEEDYFAENNIYYKSVRVIKKPAILFYSTTTSPLLPLLQQLYMVTTVNDLTSIDKETYYALVINDIPANMFEDKVSLLKDYLSDDNGLLVVGGANSFDNGGYQGSSFEDLLPILTAVAEKKDEGVVYVVLALDISKSSGTQFGQSTVADIEKAIAVSIIENLKDEHHLGVVAFNTQAYVVQDLMPLQDTREDIINKVLSLKKVGDSYIPPGLAKAMELVDKAPGAKNIILLSDGRAGGIGSKGAAGASAQPATAREWAAAAKARGITIYGVGVGDPCITYNKLTGRCDRWSDETYGVNAIKAIALDGGGSYFYGEQAPQRVKIIFGDPEEGRGQAEFSLLVVDKEHFITHDLNPRAKITGFNNVVPKKTARLLLTTDSREPLVTVWRYGISRVATLSTDDGTVWAGELLGREDSLVVTKTLNWVIGDPEKKNKRFVYIQDTNLGRNTEVLVRDEQPPVVAGLTFYKKENVYSATLTPETTGFQTLLSTDFAVNYNKELEGIGMSDSLQDLVVASGGEMYAAQDIEGIVSLKTPLVEPTYGKRYLQWLFVLAALLVFLLEILARRIREHKSI